jgi:arsenate reductase
MDVEETGLNRLWSMDTAVALGRDSAERLARTLRAVADPTRLQLLSRIIGSVNGEALVGELADALKLTQPTVSHHMRVMVDDGLLEREKRGRQVWYSIVPARRREIIDTVLGAVAGQPAEARAELTELLTAAGVPEEANLQALPAVVSRIAADLADRFAGTFSRETVARYVIQSYALLEARAGESALLPSLASQFAADRLSALATATAVVPRDVPEVLFVCVQNAGRSQLAAALLRSLGGDRVRVRTAGSEPAASVNPIVIEALNEIGVPLHADFPKPLTDEVVRAADYVITMGCGDACPIYPGRRYLDWDLQDPVGQPVETVRGIRDDIERRVRGLLDDITAGR